MDDRDVFEELLAEELESGITRADVLKRGAAAGVGIAGVSALFGPGTALAGMEARSLTPTFYQWIYDNYPVIPKNVNKDYAKTHKLDAKIAPVAGFGIERFVAEAKKKKSTWDVYVGMTPFVEMAALIEAGTIEPWDKYIPKSVLNDLIPSIRAEATYKGHIWSFPFLLDIIIQAWNGDLVEKAGLDPNQAPKTWDGFIANAKKVVSSKAAPYGAVFDAHGWRSLAPIAHTFSTNVYTPAGLFDFTSDAAVNALEIMKRLMEVAPKNILEEGKTDGGVNITPDEEAFSARQAAYYIKYQNAPTRFAGTWPDPSKLHIAGLPKARSGAAPCSGTRAQRSSSTGRTSSRRPPTWSTSLGTCASGSTLSARMSGARRGSSLRTSPTGRSGRSRHPPGWPTGRSPFARSSRRAKRSRRTSSA